MARYERGKTGSGEFWEVRTDGASLQSVLTTRWGRIGTEGEVQTQTLPSGMEARAMLRRLVQEKEAQGYRRVVPMDRSPWLPFHPELEAAILRAPEAPDGYLVYGDWLQSQGDPRGELIALQHALLQAREEDAHHLEQKVSTLLAEHRGLLLGHSLSAAVDDRTVSVQWHLGFIRSARLTTGEPDEDPDFDVEGALELLLAHPSARFLQELTLGLVGRHGLDNNYGPLIAVIVKAAPKALRTLFIGDFDAPRETQLSRTYVGGLSPLFAVVPGLRSLRVRGTNIVPGDIDLPELRELTLETDCLFLESVQSIVNARWPKLERLEVWFGTEDQDTVAGIADLEPLLDARGIPELRHLGLCNAEFTDALCEALPRSKVMKQLHTLDLSRGTLTDAGVEVLLANAAAFAHLRRLDLTQNLLTEAGAKRLETLCPDVRLDHQRAVGMQARSGARAVAVSE